MKKLLFVLILMPAITFAQEMQEPFRQANTILVHTSDDKITAMQNLVSILIEKGFTIKNSDTDLGLLSTNFLSVHPLLEVSYNCFVREKDGETVITVKGRWYNPSSTTYGGDMPIICVNWPLSMAPRAWEEMKQTFATYPDAFVLYAKK